MPRDPQAAPQRWRFTVEDYHRLAEVGILGAQDRVELLDGELVKMSPIGTRHASTVARLNWWLGRLAGDLGVVWPQNPVVLDDHSEPQPDLVLLRPREDFYAQAHPRPVDVLLAIEVGDSSARFDERVKAPLYARAGIAELWLVDVEAEVVMVCRRPGSDGVYAEVARRRRGERVAVEALPGVELSVDQVLGAPVPGP